MTEERTLHRLAAILAVDVFGYSRLMEQNDPIDFRAPLLLSIRAEY
jgi:hypothetical protein